MKFASVHGEVNVFGVAENSTSPFTVQKMLILNTDNHHVKCVTEWKSLQFIAEMWCIQAHQNESSGDKWNTEKKWRMYKSYMYGCGERDQKNQRMKFA